MDEEVGKTRLDSYLRVKRGRGSTPSWTQTAKLTMVHIDRNKQEQPKQQKHRRCPAKPVAQASHVKSLEGSNMSNGEIFSPFFSALCLILFSFTRNLFSFLSLAQALLSLVCRAPGTRPKKERQGCYLHPCPPRMLYRPEQRAV